MSSQLHWCYNDYMTMPIYQLIYWANKASDDLKQQAKEAEKARKDMAKQQKRFRR